MTTTAARSLRSRADELIARDEDPELVYRLLGTEFGVDTDRARHEVLAAQLRHFTRLARTSGEDRDERDGTGPGEAYDDIIPGFGVGSPLAALRVVTETA